MRALLAIALLSLAWLGLPGAGHAQEGDKDLLTRFLQNQLSDAGREVSITGFAGALSSRATIDTIEVADAQGVWLTLEGLVLDWNRTAALAGRIEIAELTATRIGIARAPVAPDTAPRAEAAPAFTLPELPVSIRIDRLDAARIELGETLLGQPLAVAFDGAISLADGAGSVTLAARRIDGQEGRFDIAGSFDNASGQLTIDVDLSEGDGGIAAGLLGLPGAPALALTLQGDAPISDFPARLSLAADGAERVSGEARVTTRRDAETSALIEQRLEATLGGDVASLIAEDYRDFFGNSLTMELAATRTPATGTEIDRLSLTAAAIALEGDAAFGPDGWPERFRLQGTVAGRGGAPVRLPLAGAGTFTDRIALDLNFDAAAGDRWTGDFGLEGLSAPGLSARRLALSADGTIDTGTSDGQGAMTGRVTFDGAGVAFDDPGLAQALGSGISGGFEFDAATGAPFRATGLTLSGPGIDLAGTVSLGQRIELDLSAAVEGLARLSTLAGRDLGGAAALDLSGTLEPLTGAFDLSLDARTTDLAVGLDWLDPLLSGNGAATLSARRNADGLFVEGLRLSAAQAVVEGDARITSGPGELSARLDLADLGRLIDGFAGPGQLTLRAERAAAGPWDAGFALQSEDITGSFDGQISVPVTAPATLSGALALIAERLDPLAGLTGLPLSGAARIELEGAGQATGGVFDLTLAAETRDLAIGSGAADRLLAGEGRLEAQLSRGADGLLSLDGLVIETPEIVLEADVLTDGNVGNASYSARLRDLAIFAPEFPGALDLSGRAVQSQGGTWTVETSGTGPGGTAALVSGRIDPDGRLDLGATGQAPLALANVLIAPRRLGGLARFDLRISGPPSLQSVSGRVTSNDGRLSDPTIGRALTDIALGLQLNGGQAALDLEANVSTGGRIAADGSVGLLTPFNATVDIAARDVDVRDGKLYQSSADADLRVTGPLAGAFRIGGEVALGRTEIRITSVPPAGLSALPGIEHQGASATVLRTIERAGLGPSGSSGPGGGSGASAAPGLDLLVRAPERIFVRGRGLDAELGGELRIGGTISDPVALGRFDLIRGRLDILQQRFDLTEGAALLEGDFTPYLRLVARTQTDDATISVTVEGPATEPQVTFASQPDLPQDEVVARLIFGRGLTEISALRAIQLASAVATLAGREGGAFDRLRDSLGVDDIDIATDETGGAQLTVGAYLSDNVYSDVTVNSAGESEITLNLDLTQDITARGSAATTGETGLGVFFERDY